MQTIFPDDGLVQALKGVADNQGNGWVYAVYTNDLTPDMDSVFADFSIPADAWAKHTVVLADWILEQVVLHVGTIQGEPLVFTNPAISDIDLFGFLAYDPISHVVLLAERFEEAPITLASGQSVDVPLQIGDASESTVPIIDGGEF